jgi:SAM-dependent methyltransferase
MPEHQSQRCTELDVIYGNRFDRAELYRNSVWRTLIQRWFQSHIPANSAVLDLGCGYGQFINNVVCARKYAMDLNPVSKSKLNPEVEFFEQDCAATWNLSDNSLDVVFSSNFFEHLLSKEDLAKTVREVFRCLRKGGRIIVMGPNIRFVGGAYWDFFDHNIALTELSVKECLETAGFHSEYLLDRFLPYTMVNAPQYPLAFLRFYLKAPFAWKWFGKQFLVIAAKP